MASYTWETDDDGKDIEVAIDTRVVAAGLDSENQMARLTLVLSPAEKSGADDTRMSVKLGDWPRQIDAYMRSGACNVWFAPVLSGGGRPGPDGDTCFKIDVSLAEAQIASKDELDKVTMAWRHLMAPRITGDGVEAAKGSEWAAPWQRLYDVIKENTISKADPGGDLAFPELKSAGSIVSVPRVDIALFLSIWRSRVLLDRLASGGGKIVDPGCDVPGTPQTWAIRDNIIDELVGDWTALRSGAKKDTGGSTTRAEAELLDELVSVYDKAKSQWQARSRYLDCADASKAFDALLDQCVADQCREAHNSKSRSVPPAGLLQALALTEKDALRRLLARYIGLQSLALAPDEQLRRNQVAQTAAAEMAAKKLRDQTEPEKVWVGLKNDTWERPDRRDDAVKKAIGYAKSRLFALQSNPALARVFRFVVDVEIPASKLKDALSKQKKVATFYEADTVDWDEPGQAAADFAKSIQAGKDTKTHYGFLACTHGASAGKPKGMVIWSTAKIRWTDAIGTAGASGHFLPCTREEMDIAAASATDLLEGKTDRLGRGRDVSCTKVEVCDGQIKKRIILPAVIDGALAQFDGVVDLGAGRRVMNPRYRNPRFDVVSLEAIGALEHQLEVIRSLAARPDGAPEQKRGPQRPTLHTEGLVIIDRWRASTYIAGLVDQAKHIAKCSKAGDIVLDASDLGVGYQLDVGVKPGKASNLEQRHIWRSLTARSINYKYQDTDILENILSRLGYAEGSRRRVSLDSAIVMPTGRVVTASEGNASSKIFPEEILASWNGEPIGVQCRKEDASVDPRIGLGVSMTYSYPANQNAPKRIDYQIPPLRFGARYRLGLRQVFIGGVVTPLARAAGIYEEAAGGTLALPPAILPEHRVASLSDAQLPSPSWDSSKPDVPWIQGRRFLRHERLKAPTAVLPSSEVDRIGKIAPGGKVAKADDHTFVGYPIESASLLTLRTAGDPDLCTKSATRVIVAPSEPQDFVLRHGVFDREPRVYNGVRLIDGLPNVLYDAKRGGFRIRDTGNKVSQSHKRIPPKATSDFSLHCSAVGEKTEPPKPEENVGGDAVFSVGKVSPGGHALRAEPYFPDPAASSVVLAVRRLRTGEALEDGAGREADYLPGTPLKVDLALNGLVDVKKTPLGYPTNVVPLFLECKISDDLSLQRLDPRKVSQELILKHVAPLDVGTINALCDFETSEPGEWAEDGGTTPAKRVRINLVAGEEFALDIWCLPSEEALRWFDMIESSAMLSVARGRVMNGNADLEQSCADGLQAFTGSNLSRLDLKRYDPGELIAQTCGAGALDLPCEAAVKKIARLVYEQLRLRPICEVAAVRTMRLTHAVAEPLRPAFNIAKPISLAMRCPLGDDRPTDLQRTGLALHRGTFRPADKHVKQSAVELASARWAFVAGTPVEQWTAALCEEGATDLLIGGAVQADQRTAHSVTLLADIVSPTVLQLDDEYRGRPKDRLGTALSAREAKMSHKIFGFHVSPNGKIAFPMQRKEILCLQNLPSPDADGASAPGNQLVNLLLTGSQPKVAMRSEAELLRLYLPADTIARRMVLQLRAETRFRPCFQQISGKNALDLTKKGTQTLLVKSSRSSVTSEDSATVPEPNDPPPFSNADLHVGQVEMWIPATQRPKPIEPKSIIPAFVWQETVDVRSRNNEKEIVVTGVQRMKVRLRFRRPWFSSGEGERLGIVLFPHDIFDERKYSFMDGFFSRFFAEPGGILPKDVEPFITRWGADPIGIGNVTGDEYMPREAFPDALCRDRDDVMLVSGVTMPLPEADKDGPLVKNATKDYKVALLAYEPRFDVTDETWYVDVELATGGLPDCFVRFGLVRYQPNAKPDQQVSVPTPVTVQILPEREVIVRCTRATGAGRGSHVIDMQVRGQAMMRAGNDKELDSNPRYDSRHRPVIRPTVCCVEQFGENEEIRDADCTPHPKFKLTDEGFILPRRDSQGLLWEHRVLLNAKDTGPADSRVAQSKYRIVLEETKIMRPATAAGDVGLVEMGPRFAATIDLVLDES